MKIIIFVLIAFGVASYTLHKESQLGKIHYNKYHLTHGN
jgi:hypothetical protein